MVFSKVICHHMEYITNNEDQKYFWDLKTLQFWHYSEHNFLAENLNQPLGLSRIILVYNLFSGDCGKGIIMYVRDSTLSLWAIFSSVKSLYGPRIKFFLRRNILTILCAWDADRVAIIIDVLEMQWI